MNNSSYLISLHVINALSDLCYNEKILENEREVTKAIRNIKIIFDKYQTIYTASNGHILMTVMENNILEYKDKMEILIPKEIAKKLKPKKNIIRAEIAVLNNNEATIRYDEEDIIFTIPKYKYPNIEAILKSYFPKPNEDDNADWKPKNNFNPHLLSMLSKAYKAILKLNVSFSPEHPVLFQKHEDKPAFYLISPTFYPKNISGIIAAIMPLRSDEPPNIKDYFPENFKF